MLDLITMFSAMGLQDELKAVTADGKVVTIHEQEEETAAASEDQGFLAETATELSGAYDAVTSVMFGAASGIHEAAGSLVPDTRIIVAPERSCKKAKAV